MRTCECPPNAECDQCTKKDVEWEILTPTGDITAAAERWRTSFYSERKIAIRLREEIRRLERVIVEQAKELHGGSR